MNIEKILNVMYDPTNKKVIGKFKGEANGEMINSFSKTSG